MAIKRKSPCNMAGCNTLTTEGRCEKHIRKEWIKKEDNISYLYHTTEWRTARRVFLADNPLCKGCESDNRTKLANVVDHVIPHRGDLELFWDVSNWQPLCTSCHNSKTSKGL